jgi:hypothetical protein
VIEGDVAGTQDRDHQQDDQIRRLFEADEIEEAVDVGALRREDRDGHADDEGHRGETREEAEHQRGAAEQLAVADHDRAEGRHRDVERREELRHLREVMDLAPARR